jgi:uncharacterized protein (DUF58 family)
MFRKLQLLLLAAVIVVAAFSTGLPFLFYLVYLGLLILGGSYVLTRLGLSDLEAGYAVSQLSGHVGDRVKVTYTLRNTSRLPKPWLEAHNPTSLPAGLPGRALALGGRTERSWAVRMPLIRRGHFRVEPLQIRTGDPFGFFESAATVGTGVSVVVYPRIEALPMWRLPAANLDGSHAMRERTLQTTPLATTVRPWAPGDAFNRIHWKSTARHLDIQVKEFDLEQTADLWVILDLDRAVQAGTGDESTVEAAVRVAASITDVAIQENRAVGATISAHRLMNLPPDRGSRQRLKLMQLLAAVDGDGTTPLSEALVAAVPRIRRGMTVVVITSSLDRSWVKPLSTLRARGVACVAVWLDRGAFDAFARQERQRRGAAEEPEDEAAASTRSQATRALRHALAEYDIRVHTVIPAKPLGDLLVG